MYLIFANVHFSLKCKGILINIRFLEIGTRTNNPNIVFPKKAFIFGLLHVLVLQFWHCLFLNIFNLWQSSLERIDFTDVCA
jgi:hypothetical protein